VIGFPRSAQEGKGPVHFAIHDWKREVSFFRVDGGYNDFQQISVSNTGQTDVKIRILLRAEAGLLVGITGPGGDTALTLPAGKRAYVPFKVFSQDVQEGIYPLKAWIENEKGQVLDRMEARIFVSTPEMDVQITPVGSEGGVQNFVVKNTGKSIPNFSLRLASSDLRVVPQIDHYLFPEGEQIQFSVIPMTAFENSFQTEFVLESPGRQKTIPFQFEKPEGKKLLRVSLDPIVRLRKKDWYCTNRPVIQMIFEIPYIEKQPIYDGALLEKRASDLQKEGHSLDINRDGKPDRWELRRGAFTIMLGDDYDGDGSIDFLRTASAEKLLDTGFLRVKQQWFKTNLLDAYLVTSFLPMTDVAQVKPHDIEILMNDQFSGGQKSVVPAGSRILQIPLTALNNNVGGASINTLTILTKHLPEAHYQVMAENTLILHYSTISIPLLGGAEIREADAAAVENEIARLQGLLDAETHPGKREMYAIAMKKVQAEKETRQKKLRDLITQNKKALELSGVQESGMDLGIYSGEIVIDKNGARGLVRNQGYERTAYRVEVYENNGTSPITSRDFPPIAPFSAEEFLLPLGEYDPSRRRVLRFVVTALPSRQEELQSSNNVAFVQSGPPPSDPEQLRKEMAAAADHMGFTQDRITLSRRPEEIRFLNVNESYSAPLVVEIPFSAPFKMIDQDSRMFILE